jgi:hypothetical protein
MLFLVSLWLDAAMADRFPVNLPPPVRLLPETPIGEQRYALVAVLRNGLLEAVRQRNPETLDSLREAGDREFGRRIWLDTEERLLLYLLSGRGDRVVLDRNMRNRLWQADDEWPSYRLFHAFCPEERPPPKLSKASLGYAPDLADHLHAWLAADFEQALGRLRIWPDLADFLRSTRCAHGTRKEPVDVWQAMQDFRDRHPTSAFSADMAADIPVEGEWTGNGWLMGGGASFGWFDERTSSLIRNGVHGGFFMDFNFPLVKIGADFQIRPFTPARAFMLGDTLRNQKGELMQIILHAGYAFRLGRNLYCTPFSGLTLSSLDLHLTEEERKGRKDISTHSMGWPLGAHLDWTFSSMAEGTGNGNTRIGLGLRLTALYNHGNWKELESGLGDEGWIAGMKVYFGLIGWDQP